MSKYSLRPVVRSSTDLKDVYKIFVAPKVYVSLKPGGSLWTLEDEQGTALAIGKLAQSQDDVQNKVLQVTHEFKDLFGLSFSDSYILKKSDTRLQSATELILVEEARDGTSSLNISDLRNIGFWEGNLYRSLLDKLISPGLRIEDVEGVDETRSFKIEAISNAESANSLRSSMDIHNMSKGCKIRIEQSKSCKGVSLDFHINRDGLFGLDEQLYSLDQKLQLYGPLQHPYKRITSAGLLLVGPAGSGAALIADRISDLPWTFKKVIAESEIGKSPATTIPQIFSMCVKNQPCLLRIQHLQDLLAIHGASLEKALTKAFSTVADLRVLILAEVEHVKASSPLLKCFRHQVYIAPPDEYARWDIILHELAIQNAEAQPESETVTVVSETTPGYTRSDLQKLVKEAIFYAHLRLDLITKYLDASRSIGISIDTLKSLNPAILGVTIEDFEEAKKLVSPSALARDQTFKHKVVRWSDIGGQEETKRTVEMLFEWPLKYPEKFKKLGLRPGKGLLLYGPPGCSKTMTALALATEAKLNFIAVKGPELLSKYVGESEENLRNIFERARSMSPCVIFFDEVDSIGSSGGTGDSRGGINLVTTLLNELDGVDELKGVSVLAATNKPWELDQALLRPGRFDGLIYVKLPDARTRRHIFQIRLAEIECDIIDKDIDMLVEETEGCSGAEIVDICRNAAMEALKEQIHLADAETKITAKHFDKALLQLRRDVSPELIALFDAFAGRSMRT